MERERRKRKKDKIEIVEDEEEEEKINKFYALIRSTRELREHLITTTSAIAGEQVQNPPPRPAATARVWNPAFRAEDFVGPCHNRAAAAAVNLSKIAIDLESPEVGPSHGEGEGEVLGKIVEKEEEEEEEEEEANVNEKEGEELDLNLSL